MVQANSVEIKTEQFVRDNHDDYMDLDLSLALSNVEENFNDVGKSVVTAHFIFFIFSVML